MSASPLNDGPPCEAAAGYAAGGWPVFPVWWPKGDGRCACRNQDCDSPAKHPIGELVPHGLKDASRDKALIRAWWEKYPSGNVGVVTGSESGIAVIDLDGDAELLTNELRNHGITWADTPTSRTGGGGRHVFLAHPGGKVPTKAGILILPSVNGGKPPQVDVRGDGGFVVAPPSLHVSGRRYVWERDPLSTELAPFQTGLLDLVRASTTPRLLTPASPGESWVVTALRGPVPEGMRNDTATRLAGFYLPKMGNDVELVVAHLEAWAQTACVPPLPGRELRTAVESIARAERAQVVVEHLTDLGNAKRLVARHGDDLRHVGLWGTWLCWDGIRWRRDETGESVRRAKELVGTIYAEASRQGDEDRRKAIAAHAMKCESDARLRAMLSLAESEIEVAITPDRLDTDGWLLNCLNGTLNLRTGTLRPHRRDDLITKMAPVAYDPTATCPTFDVFLQRTMDKNDQLIAYLQRLVGYSLTADVSEQGFDLFYGTGANGKTTLLTVLLAMFGDYGKQAAPGLLMRKYGDAHPTEVADLNGARVVSVIEVEEGKHLAEVLTKQLTGADRMKARFMRQDFFEFAPTFKIIMAVNHLPRVTGTDEAIWRRIRTTPFSVTIPKAEQDRRLPEKLKAELAGILAWGVRGCLEWQQRGLDPPPLVQDATERYRSEMDVIGDFLNECTHTDRKGSVTAKALYASYSQWCEENGESQKSQRRLAAALSERGFVRRRGREGIVWDGLVLSGGDL